MLKNKDFDMDRLNLEILALEKLIEEKRLENKIIKLNIEKKELFLLKESLG